MAGLESAGEKLGREEMEVTIDGQDLRFDVEVIDGSGGVGAGDVTQRLILHKLETVKRGRRIIRVDNRRRIVEERADQGLESRGQALLIVPERGVGQSANDV